MIEQFQYDASALPDIQMYDSYLNQLNRTYLTQHYSYISLTAQLPSQTIAKHLGLHNTTIQLPFHTTTQLPSHAIAKFQCQTTV